MLFTNQVLRKLLIVSVRNICYFMKFEIINLVIQIISTVKELEKEKSLHWIFVKKCVGYFMGTQRNTHLINSPNSGIRNNRDIEIGYMWRARCLYMFYQTDVAQYVMWDKIRGGSTIKCVDNTLACKSCISIKQLQSWFWKIY